MLLDKKYIYLGASLFSAAILASLSTQNAKADTTSVSPSTTDPASSVTDKTSTDPTKSNDTSVTASNTTQVVVAKPTTSGVKPVSATLVTPETTTISTASTASPTLSTTPTSTVATPSTTAATTSTVTGSSTTSGSTASTTPSSTTTSSTSPVKSSSITTSTTINLTGGPTTTPETKPTTPSTTAPTGPYALPSNVTDNTVVNFTDPFLNYMVKKEFGLQSTDPLTVATIKGFSGNILNLVGDFYYGNMPKSVTSTNVTSFDGMQYLSYLPSSTEIALTVNVSSDSTSNPDLTPMNGLKFESFDLFGNYSDPLYKEIPLSQIPKLNISNVDELGFHGDGDIAANAGLNNKELAMMAPTIVELANKGAAIYIGNSSITDFSPLNGIDQTKNSYINVINNVYDPTPVHAVVKQPISFTATHIEGLYGNDLSTGYDYSTSVPAADLSENNLEHISGDEYKLSNADPSSNLLTYGYLNDYSKSDSYIHTTYGTVTFIYAGTMARPILWQDHPNVTLNYENEDGSPIITNGTRLTKVANGTTIGDAYDLTSDAQLAGYKFVGDLDSLKGNYTQDPQVIDLRFKADPVVTPPVTTPTTTPSTAVSNKPASITRSDVDLPVLAVSAKPVYTYDSTGTPTGKQVVLTDTTIKESANINGDLYYQIGPDEWVLADSYNPYVAETGVVKTLDGAYTSLVDSTGSKISSTLGPNTSWKYDRIVEIKGSKYYEVGTNNFLAVDSSLPFKPVSDLRLTVRDAAVVYDSKGQRVGKILSSNSDWRTDGIAVIGGIPMYHVGSNQWIYAQDVNTYQPADFTYHNVYLTNIYTSDGQMTMKMLGAETLWKVDRIVYINGTKYYRVGSDEYIKDYASSTTSSEGVFIPAEKSVVHIAGEARLYNEKGDSLAESLAANSSWQTDGYENIGGQMMYRVGKDEFVSFSDLKPYTLSKDIISVAVNTPLYDSKGALLDVFLPSGSLWRYDRTTTIGGHEYVRVAADEFVRV
ncbi:SLAP domain-containing protein [Companilactobacillus sp. HBUAS56275]|uniref:SLAP domain-containing protein n=1 Tax=Candidatus Companilactobacillus pullicola TaxID=2838523 RepID=A0A9D1ZKZ1_9LACO|nr:SLAP domain-containing protein [Candidatus Companilactobacillus pullicola]